MNNLKFGIEVETKIPALSEINVGRYHAGNPIPDSQIEGFNGRQWKAERDGSIQVAPGEQACEFVSPILSGRAGVINAINAIRKMKETFGAKVNASCGIHVTVEFNGDSAALARLVNLVGNFEAAFYAVTGTKNRQNGRYCKPLKSYGTAEVATRAARMDRYHVLNLTHIANGSSRVEFRCFAGSLNTLKIVGYIMMCLAVVEVALNSKIRPFDAQTTAKPGKGFGQSEVERFFGTMNWIGVSNFADAKGNVYESLEDTSLPCRKSVRKTLIEMAQKYDAA